MTRVLKVDEAFVEIEGRLRKAKVFGRRINPLDTRQMVIAAYQMGLTEQVKEYLKKGE